MMKPVIFGFLCGVALVVALGVFVKWSVDFGSWEENSRFGLAFLAVVVGVFGAAGANMIAETEATK